MMSVSVSSVSVTGRQPCASPRPVTTKKTLTCQAATADKMKEQRRRRKCVLVKINTGEQKSYFLQLLFYCQTKAEVFLTVAMA